MRFAVISDTHIGEHRKEPPAGFWKIVESGDAVIHLGDFVSEEFARRLASGRELYGVSGNSDPYAVRKLFPPERVLDVEGVKVLLVHRFPSDMDAAETLVEEYRRDGVSVILCGHTHRASSVEVSGVKVLNPGSPCDGRHYGRRTAGFLTLSGGRASWEVVTIGPEE